MPPRTPIRQAHAQFFLIWSALSHPNSYIASLDHFNFARIFKSKDIHGAESDWGTLEVSMPKNKAFDLNFNLLSWLFERFPNAFPILRYMLGL